MLRLAFIVSLSGSLDVQGVRNVELAILVIGAALGFLLARGFAKARPADVTEADESAPQSPTQPAAAAVAAGNQAPQTQQQFAQSEESDSSLQADPRERMRVLVDRLEKIYEDSERAADLAQHPVFVELVELIAGEPFSDVERSQWVTAQTTQLCCAALAAMTVRQQAGHEGVARSTSHMGYMTLYFALKHLLACTDPEIAGIVLLRAKPWWSEHPETKAGFVAWLNQQQQAGSMATLGSTAGEWKLDERRAALRMINHRVIENFLQLLEVEARARRGRKELAKVGQTLPAVDPMPVAETAETATNVGTLVEFMARDGRPSGVLVGAEGAGKTTLARTALRQLVAKGWRVVEATPGQLMAGQKFIGEIEQRIENFVVGLAGEQVIWFVPECHALLETGSTSGNPRGLLDLLMPHLEGRNVQMLGESTPAAWGRVLTQRPRAETVIHTLQMSPMSDDAALTLALDWANRWSERLGSEAVAVTTVNEARELGRQQFPDRAEPGRTLDLLKEALSEALRAEPPALPLSREQLLSALSRSSGLPLEVLDVSKPLDVLELRREFSAAVIGQTEAVDGLVDRISMLKAGLTDPQRPIGVYLFAGPTGTGKTELAKTLARYLFGSTQRMLRVDMSEYQSSDSYWRLIDDGAHGRTQSLTTRIRQNPFAVVLLDEFEKAHPRVWDVFLQVFDDGRLTDRSGNTADFRHSIIILTSNLGSTITKSDGIGFIAQRGGFNRELVDRAINQTFRPEFINRLDRVVVFNPLTRALMRDILKKELRGVLSRRGFRNRDWAVEWEPSAIEFLLDKGFTTDLGARPLRRAIDQYLLAPLARTMVEHRTPDGEQFLFVHGDGDALRVRFVDPDAQDDGVTASGDNLPKDLRALALDPQHTAAAISALQREVERAAELIEQPAWQTLKENAALAMQAPDFWDRSERTDVLDRLERVDRIESGLRSAQSLLGRLERGSGRGSADLVRRLALLVLALPNAIEALLQNQPEDAVIQIQPTDPRSPTGLAWRDRLLAMYLSWAKARGMRINHNDVDTATAAVSLTVNGYAAHQSLRPEDGLHVLDTRDDKGDLRQSARVTVSSDPPGDEQRSGDTDTRVCRRYEDGSSPLVRDHVRGWRTGHLDRVLAGDFDLIAENAD